MKDDLARLIDDGSVLVCPCCGGASAHCWADTTAYDEFEDGIVPGGFTPAPGTIAHVGAASCWEWECGHCRARLADADSPLTHPCYTHKED